MKKSMIPCIYLQSEKAVNGFGQRNLFGDGDVAELTRFYSENGADSLLIFDFSVHDAEHERAIARIREICEISEVPVMAAGNIKRLEDIKKLIYAGCARVILNFSKQEDIDLLPEGARRFGKEKMIVCISRLSEYTDNQKVIEDYAAGILVLEALQEKLSALTKLPVIVHTDENSREEILQILQEENVCGISGSFISSREQNIHAFKELCTKNQIPVELYESDVDWSEFKLNSDGLIPVIVQDYRTDEVLMLAYMNEEAFRMTLRSGKMTYFSRSRQEIWVKGLTSGHFQYVKELRIDCDNDTILAKVDQIGAACHTGNRSCFYRTLIQKEYDDTNPLRVFQNVYDIIEDRKAHPREGSYTNYLFDKGIDKILKKVGEECTEIVIAAKNPDKDEIKYEISDFLYHVMVLMVEKGVTWEEITRELARR
ncbi:MAG: bifunctional phosphoribosyl-AMP cyclohydrolase/phosphoribosyl-ATP diphosphatase HisIE [Blautia sp.]|nr:bifunctional phosphoribosyl-AMP cyclohydrolase/phosphoribosyl-ATP diphosphatase HisIE [Blautia sp.]